LDSACGNGELTPIIVRFAGASGPPLGKIRHNRVQIESKKTSVELTDLKGVFESIAITNKWGSEESRSGAGSTLLYTYNLRHELENVVSRFEVTAFFDAPCGDFNWMKAVSFPEGMKYIGGDIVSSLIRANNLSHASASREFIEFDITKDRFPSCDMWFCRDCLFHLSFVSIFQALSGFCESNAKYVMMTNHVNTSRFRNRDIQSGDFRLLDFYIKPFNLPRNVLYLVPDYVFPFPRREMCVWSRAQIIAALKARRA
jgi:hypothetical protein